MKYYLLYVEGCESKIKSFEDRDKVDKFILKFNKKHSDNLDDNWVDLTFKASKLEPLNECYTELLKRA